MPNEMPPLLREKLRAFLTASQELNAAMELCGQNVSEGYPFDKSFDEVDDEIANWVLIQTP